MFLSQEFVGGVCGEGIACVRLKSSQCSSRVIFAAAQVADGPLNQEYGIIRLFWNWKFLSQTVKKHYVSF